MGVVRIGVVDCAAHTYTIPLCLTPLCQSYRSTSVPVQAAAEIEAERKTPRSLRDQSLSFLQALA